MAFLHLAAPRPIAAALQEAELARLERDTFEDGIPTVMVMQEREGERRPTFVLQRGAYDAPGEPVSPATPHFLPAPPAGDPPDRLALARWLVSRDNPLTARVTVNRLWAMVFGTGLVKTTEDFGAQGEWPSHPELLDWLAVEFMDSGWDLRHMLRLMVTSATYRQSSRPRPELLERDPENRLLARGPRFRLPAEMVRDQALAISGLLVRQTGGPSVKPYQPAGLWTELHGGTDYEPDSGQGLYRRSLYSYWKRTIPPPMMIAFDAPTREVCTVRTSRSNTPLQALNLMNDVTFVEAARRLAETAVKEQEPASRVAFLVRQVLAREPSPAEADRLQALLAEAERHFGTKPEAARRLLAYGASPVTAQAPGAELAALTTVVSLLMNLDEVVTRQ